MTKLTKSERLLMHTKMWWLAKGNCLRCFVEAEESIVLLLNSKQLAEQFWPGVIYSTSRIYFKSLVLWTNGYMEKYCNLISCKEIITAFIENLKMFIVNLRCHKSCSFRLAYIYMLCLHAEHFKSICIVSESLFWRVPRNK